MCGSGYGVIDSHSLGAATIYLLYSNATGNNCVVTLVARPAGAVAMNATLSVQGGGSASNPGNFSYYAGPVSEHPEDLRPVRRLVPGRLLDQPLEPLRLSWGVAGGGVGPRPAAAG